MKNSNVVSWGEAFFELCSERPLALMPSISRSQENLQDLNQRLVTTLTGLCISFEILFVENCGGG
jgi:hypothetical protein